MSLAATDQEFDALLASLQTAVNALNTPSTYSTASASSSDTAVASISALPGATLGDHVLTVTQLAQAQKVVSAPIASSSAALGQTGSFTLNGKTIRVTRRDALADIAVKINRAQAGASAHVVNIGSNDFRLTLSSNQTGAVNSIAAADSSGTVLSSLGLIQSGTAGIRQSISYAQGGALYAGAASLTLGSATQSIGALLGIAAGSAPSGAFHLSNGATGTGNAADISVNLNTDSLTDIANAINQSGIVGVSAEVVTVPDANGNLNRVHQLRIVSSEAAPTFSDPNGILETTGVLQNQYAQTIIPATEAQFTFDGLDLTRATNTISDLIPGTAIHLLSGTPASPGITTLSVSQHVDTLVQAVTRFATAYNAYQDFITSLNSTTGNSPTIYSNTILPQFQTPLAQTLTEVSGATTLESVGVTLDQNGRLQVDFQALTQSIQANLSIIQRLFSLSGATDTDDIQFLTGNVKTAATTGVGYAVFIKQPATQSSVAARTAFGATPGSKSARPETLTFGGTLFPAGSSVTLPTGSTLRDTANLINSSPSLNTQIYATIDSSSHLVISSLNYGSKTEFSISSDQAADGANSGFGNAPAGLAILSGQDVAGTINGEPATGQGRTLTGNAGNAHTEGIQLLISAATAFPAGSVIGHVTLTHGIADRLSQALTQILDPVNGSVVSAESSLNAQISETQDQIAKIQAEAATYQAYLSQMFSDMETRVRELQSQGKAFAARTGSASTLATAARAV